MKVACIQMDMKFAEPYKNTARALHLIRQASENGIDVAVLPETWNTGFFPHEYLDKLADDNGKRTREAFGALAKELNINIVAGSVANRKADGIYNTAYVFNRSGECLAEYDKTHLFSPMHEDDHFRKGTHTCTFTLDGVKCGIIICYDIRFPELTRTMTVKGVDMLFVVSQWPLVRVPHLDALTRARAIENQMFVVCCNSAGTAGQTVYGGNSSITDPWGEVIAHAAGQGEEIICADCDMSIIDNIRDSINVFRDRRPELYNVN